MADLSSYLFWFGLIFAVLASGAYLAYVVGPAVGARRLTGITEAGTVTISANAPRAPSPGLGRIASSLAWFTAAALACSLAARWVAIEHAPLSNLYEFTTAFAFAIAATYTVFEATTGQRRFGVLGLPIVLVMLLVATRFPDDIVPLIPALQNAPLLTIHVSAMMISYAVLTMAFCCAVIYLLQGGEHGRRFAALPRGDVAGDLAHRAVMVGFPLLGLGIALGAWWANSAWGRYWGWDPKETSALVTWLSLAVYFHARAGTGSVAGAPGVRRFFPDRLRRGWRPDPMWWLIITWGLVMFTYFGVNLWISGLHSYAGV
jgi:cytochrome c-type biogenesis protein CcsB